MKQNKIVIFDWGGVIESHSNQEYSSDKAALNLFKEMKVDLSDYDIIKKYHECCYDTHDINDINKVYEIYKKAFKLEYNITDFIKKYNKHFSKIEYYKDIVTLAHSLKEKCHIGILSNLNPLDKVRIDNQLNLKEFDYVWLSFELNCDKPNKKIYEIVENDTNISSNNILFIDDLEKNLEFPKLKGWNTCQATGLEFNKIKTSIEEFLNK